MPNVSFTRPELTKRFKQYALIRDALAGEQTVKGKGALYLPPPETLATPEGRERYTSYIGRAVFYNVTRRTQRGFIGQVFGRDPEVNTPDFILPMVGNMDGVGTSLIQQTKNTVAEVIACGRGGLLSDFPTIVDGQEVSAADIQSGRVSSTITPYRADQIINWRFYRDYTTKKLLFVILQEEREVYKANEFTFTTAKQWRVCRLDEGGLYVQELYYDNQAAPVVTVKPCDYAGDRLDYIPFQFIGAEDNDPSIDDPPMYDIASVNMAHYRNSADFEDSLWFVGQPTVVITGLSENWVKNIFKGEPIKFGSRFAIPLPTGASCEIVQADPNTLSKDGMDSKERQMVALGAKLVQERQVQRTATEAAQEHNVEQSVLGTVADNVSVAYANAIATACKFVSGNDVNILFKLSTSFETQFMDAASLAEVVKEWQMGAICYAEMRQVMRRAGHATLPDKEALANSLQEEKERADLLSADPANNNPNANGDLGA